MRLSLSYIIDILLSMPKTIYFNFRCLPFYKAVRLPFYIHYKTRLSGTCKDSIKIAQNTALRTFMIKFGNKGSVGIVENRYNSICINNGTLLFEGSAALGVGFSIRVDCGGKVTIGKGFNSNRNLFISCTKQVTIGNDVLFGWNISVRDSDGHTLLYDNTKQPTIAPVTIGNHVWVCAESHILKGTAIGNDCVVGYASLVSKGGSDNNVLWAGHPAKIIKQKVNWDSAAWDV